MSYVTGNGQTACQPGTVNTQEIEAAPLALTKFNQPALMARQSGLNACLMGHQVFFLQTRKKGPDLIEKHAFRLIRPPRILPCGVPGGSTDQR